MAKLGLNPGETLIDSGQMSLYKMWGPTNCLLLIPSITFSLLTR